MSSTIWQDVLTHIHDGVKKVEDLVTSGTVTTDLEKLEGLLKSPQGIAFLEALGTAIASAAQPLSLQTFLSIAPVVKELMALLDSVPPAPAPTVTPAK